MKNSKEAIERHRFNSIVSGTLMLGEKSHELHAKVLDTLKSGNKILRRSVNEQLKKAPLEAGEILEKSVRRTDFVIENIADIHPGVLKRIMGTQKAPTKKNAVEPQHMALMVRAFKNGKTSEEVKTYFPQYTNSQVQQVEKLYKSGKIKLSWRRGAKVWG